MRAARSRSARSGLRGRPCPPSPTGRFVVILSKLERAVPCTADGVHHPRLPRRPCKRSSTTMVDRRGRRPRRARPRLRGHRPMTDERAPSLPRRPASRGSLPRRPWWINGVAVRGRDVRQKQAASQARTMAWATANELSVETSTRQPRASCRTSRASSRAVVPLGDRNGDARSHVARNSDSNEHTYGPLATHPVARARAAAVRAEGRRTSPRRESRAGSPARGWPGMYGGGMRRSEGRSGSASPERERGRSGKVLRPSAKA